MSKQFSKIPKSDIHLDIKVESPKETKELQRTEKWQQDRKGRWTGSQKKALMSCSRSGGRLSWLEPSKVFDFGDTSLKYIYENAMERKTGRYIDKGQGTTDMRYGTKVEPLIVKMLKKELKKQGSKLKYKPVGFKEYPNINTAGVSSDGILTLNKKVDAVVEIKACTNWGSHYDRTFEFTDDKSIDFWQMQSEMIAWEVNKCYYVVAEPPKDIKKYANYDGDIMDLYKDFKKEVSINIEIVKPSDIHQKALVKRIHIAEDALNNFLEKGGSLKEILYRTIDSFKNNP